MKKKMGKIGRESSSHSCDYSLDTSDSNLESSSSDSDITSLSASKASATKSGCGRVHEARRREADGFELRCINGCDHFKDAGARAIGLRARGLSPRAGDLVVDSPCPPLLSKREHCRHSQPPALCTLCSHLSTSGWWGGHPVNTHPMGTRFGTRSALYTFNLRLLPFWSFVLCYPAVCPARSASP